VQQLSSRAFRDYVIASFTEAERGKIVAAYRSDDPADPPPELEKILAGGLSVENLKNSFVLQVRVRHRDPEWAAALADRYTSRYIRFMLDRSSSGNSAAVTFLAEQAEELRRQVEQAERELQDYRQRYNVVSLEENQNIIVQRLKDVSSSLTNARVARLNLEAQFQQMEEARRNGGDLLEINFVSRYGSIPGLLQELDQLRSRREVMGERYGSRHPRMVENERAIAAAERMVRENADGAVADLRSQLDQARQQESNLQAELAASEAQSLALDKLTIEFNVLRRNLQGHQATYDQIIQRLNQTRVTSQLDNTNIKLVDRAALPQKPVEPNVKKTALLLLFLGGFLFVGVPLACESFDNKLKTAWDVEHFLKQKLAGELPSLAKLAEADRPHVMEKDLNDHAVEAFRGLYSHLQLSSEREFPKTLLVTSTVPGEGKSFVISNLGYCYAAHGKTTLMVDFDLRRPTLHRLYGLKNDRGLLPWLEEGGKLDGDPIGLESLGIVEVGPNLYLLRSGGHTKKATEMIANPKIALLIEALRRRFDLVAIDTPPLGVFPDALALASSADEALYVVRCAKVARQQVKNFIGRLAETDAELLGLVMNDMPAGSRSKYYYYSGYGYGNYKYAKYYAERA
jgi:polysaccharide biosynthesis transport protein